MMKNNFHQKHSNFVPWLHSLRILINTTCCNNRQHNDEKVLMTSQTSLCNNQKELYRSLFVSFFWKNYIWIVMENWSSNKPSMLKNNSNTTTKTPKAKNTNNFYTKNVFHHKTNRKVPGVQRKQFSRWENSQTASPQGLEKKKEKTTSKNSLLH